MSEVNIEHMLSDTVLVKKYVQITMPLPDLIYGVGRMHTTQYTMEHVAGRTALNVLGGPQIFQHVSLDVVGLFPLVKNRVSTGAQCLGFCSPMAPPPLLPALSATTKRFTIESSSLLHMTSASYTAQSLCDFF